jgi:uncharacterized protein
MKIPVLHLEDGIHCFEETINSESLDFYRENIYPHPLQVQAELNKFQKNIQCSIKITSRAQFNCDRCLKEIEQPVKIHFNILLHIDKTALETDEEDVIHVPADVVEIDITERIVEQLILAIPMKTLCSADCKGICGGCGVDLNFGECQCGEAPPDPRWEKLKELKK